LDCGVALCGAGNRDSRAAGHRLELLPTAHVTALRATIPASGRGRVTGGGARHSSRRSGVPPGCSEPASLRTRGVPTRSPLETLLEAREQDDAGLPQLLTGKEPRAAGLSSTRR